MHMDEIVLARNWWSLVLRGLLGIAIGTITFFAPGITLGALVMMFGAYALLDGIMGLVGAWHASRSGARWGALLLQGFAGIAAAAVTALWPAITALALVLLIGAWAIVTGIFQTMAAVRLRRHITGEWLLALGGIFSVIFGVLVMVAPLAGALVIAIWFGAYAFVFGVTLIALGFRLRAWTRGGYDAKSPLPVPGR
jgi:uncharacterized membrane protein HdeD (DUF308 family)